MQQDFKRFHLPRLPEFVFRQSNQFPERVRARIHARNGSAPPPTRLVPDWTWVSSNAAFFFLANDEKMASPNILYAE